MMRLTRTLATLATMGLTAAGLLAVTPAAHAANVASTCSIASAPTLAVGDSATFAPATCGGNAQFTLVALTAGSTVTLDGSTSGYTFWGLYPESATDFTAATMNPWCSTNWSAMNEWKCQVPSTGAWRLKIASSTTTGFITVAAVTAVPVTAGQVPGACAISSAPEAPARVTQYADGYCPSSDFAPQFWNIHLFKNDTVAFSVNQVVGTNDDRPNFEVYPSGTTDFTRTQTTPLCTMNFIGGAQTVTCPPAAVTGWYTLQGSLSLTFSPQVTHLVVNTLVKSPTVRLKASYAVVDKLVSSAGAPTAMCVLQALAAKTWKNVRVVKAAAGRCTMKMAFTSRGYKTLRVRELGALGWSSRTMPAFKVRVL